MNRVSGDLPPMFYQDDFDEHDRIAWRIEQVKPDPANPLLESEYPWDDSTPAVGHGTILRDPIDGKFKGWTPVMSADTPRDRGECEFRLAYIESDDGVRWRRPMLDLCPWPGHPKTNLLFDNDSGGRTTYASVFVDPEANREEPYEMFCFREPHWRCPARCVAGFGQIPAKDDIDVWKYYGIYRYRSRDGIRWRGVEGPIKLKSGDSCYIHRDVGGGYVAHHKVAAPSPAGQAIPRYECAQGICRVTQRRTSPDGSNWSEPANLVIPDLRDHPSDQIMEVGRHPYGDGYIAWVTMYHALTQQMDLQFAVSADGITFWRPFPRSPCLPNPPLGDYGGGMIWPFRNPIEQNGRLYIYYGALAGLHGDIYQTKPDMRMFCHGALCRASWEPGRFFAAVNSDGGSLPAARLTTAAHRAQGQAICLNAVSGREPIRIELLEADLKPIPAFSGERASSFKGDEKKAILRWGGGEPVPMDRPIRCRFSIAQGRVYGCGWC